MTASSTESGFDLAALISDAFGHVSKKMKQLLHIKERNNVAR